MCIVWLSLLVWGAMLTFYVTREARRKADQGIHLINDDLVASYLDVITVQQDVKSQVLSEPDQIVKGALAQRYNTFRGQNGLRLYMPPLPPHVMQELRTVTAPDVAPGGDLLISSVLRRSGGGSAYVGTRWSRPASPPVGQHL